MDSGTCPLCRDDAKVAQPLQRATPLTEKIHCKCCGRFTCTHEVKMLIEDDGNLRRNLWALQGFIRERNLSREMPDLRTNNIPSIVEMAPRRIPDKTAKFLSALDRMSDNYGQSHTLNTQTDYPLAYARNIEEFTAILKYAAKRQFIERRSDSAGTHVILNAEGLEELESRRRSNLDSEKAFVAMWFTDDMKPIYDRQIAKAIEDAGYRPIRIDQEEFTGDVIDRMLAEIQESRFLVAEFTGHRNGVYFEAGFAHGLSLPVIWVCRKDEMTKAHFDINHFNHIVWDPDEGGLKERLKNRILAVIGRGPLKDSES